MSRTIVNTASVRSRRTLGAHRIRRVQVIGGFLDGTDLELSDGLNCVIGARGTGKTTALELIRFALDALPSFQNDPERRRLESLIAKNLQGGRVELTIETKEGMTYRVSRSVGESPIVLTTTGKATQISLKEANLFQADIYSQNEVEGIADRPASQLGLLDAFEAERVAAINGHLNQLIRDLDTSAGMLEPMRLKIAALEEELAALPSLNEALKNMASAGGDNAETINEAHACKALRDREQRALEGTAEFLRGYTERLEEMQGQVGARVAVLFSRDVGSSGPNAGLVEMMKESLLTCAGRIDASLDEARRHVDEALQYLDESAQQLQMAHNEQELEFRKLIEQHQAAQGQAAERSRLEKARNELLAKQHNRDDLANQLKSLQAKRQTMLQQLSVLRDERFEIRRQVAQRISAALRDVVRVSVTQHGSPAAYQEVLAAALKNAKVKSGIVVPKLVNAFWPERLIELVRLGDTATMVAEAELSAEQAAKVVDALANSPVLHELETVELADLPRIELNEKGEYKESACLSTGQKCTTILPILLLESERPLLIDQPEDNLDNRFVFEGIVGSLRSVKQRRQLIFVTHNPNIPVLGDAERVFVLESNGSRACVAKCGSVDDCKEEIVTLLEGGEEAFRQRQSRYDYA